MLSSKLQYFSNLNTQVLTPRWNYQPLLSSQGLDWQGIQFDHYQHHPSVLSQNSSQHLLQIFLSEGDVKGSLDDQERIEHISPGDVTIIPADTDYYVSLPDEIEFILLTLKPNLFKDLGKNKLDGNTVDILPQFAVADPLIAGIAITLKNQLERDRACSDYAQTLGKAIAVHLLKKYSKPSTANDSSYKNAVEKKLQVVLEHIEQNLDEKLTLDSIAKQVNLSKYYLCRLFARYLAISPHQYIIQKRIEKSKRLLKQELSLQIVEIAFDCGFASHSHFNRQFNKNVGISPRDYRNAA